MPQVRRFGLLDLLLLLLVLAAAGGARAGYLIACADGGGNGGPLLVQDRPPELDVLVRNLTQKQSFASAAPFSDGEETTAHFSPGYPYLLALLGRSPAVADVERAMRWLQCALGALTAGLYYLFARRAFRSLSAGLLVGLMSAAYPFWVIDTTTIADGVLATFLLALCLWLGARASQTGGWLEGLLFGLALAALALVRAALLPFAFLTIVWFLLRTRNLRRGWLTALLAFLGFAGGLAPWTARNLMEFREPLPVVDSAHLHLWVGNNPDATGGPGYPQPSELVAELQKKPQPQRYDELGKRVFEQVRDDPAGAVKRRIWAGLMFVFGEAWFVDRSKSRLAEVTQEGAMPEWLANGHPVALPATLLGLLLLALLGWRLSSGWRWESMPAALAVLCVPLPYVLSHAETLSGPRLPLDGVLLCYAAFALACLLPGGAYLREAKGAGEEQAGKV